MTTKHVSIQFCGGCNPRINRSVIFHSLEQILRKNNINLIVNSADADFIIYLSGCLANCASKFNPSHIPYVVIAATTVDGEELAEDDISIQAMDKVRDYFGKLEKALPG
jgi:hypothetical protein